MSATDHLVIWYLGLQQRILADPRFLPLARFLSIDPNCLHDLDHLRQRHQVAMRRINESLSAQAESLMVAAIDAYARLDRGVPSPEPSATMAATMDVDDAAERLSAVGHVTLPPIPDGWVAAMRRHFESSPVYPGTRRGDDGALCDLAAARRHNLGQYPTATVLQCPHLMEIASDPAFLAVLEQTFGAPPLTVSLSAWWSFAGHGVAWASQRFHCDYMDYRFCKLFLYLTDVDEDGGPHVFVEGSHDLGYLAKLRDGWPAGRDAFQAWMFHDQGKTDDDVRRAFDRAPVTLAGPAGSRLAVDTRGVHKGLLPRASDRLICQITYGVTPNLYPALYDEGLVPVPRQAPEAALFPARARRAPYDYLLSPFLEPAFAPPTR